MFDGVVQFTKDFRLTAGIDFPAVRLAVRDKKRENSYGGSWEVDE